MDGLPDAPVMDAGGDGGEDDDNDNYGGDDDGDNGIDCNDNGNIDILNGCLTAQNEDNSSFYSSSTMDRRNHQLLSHMLPTSLGLPGPRTASPSSTNPWARSSSLGLPGPWPGGLPWGCQVHRPAGLP